MTLYLIQTLLGFAVYIYCSLHTKVDAYALWMMAALSVIIHARIQFLEENR